MRESFTENIKKGDDNTQKALNRNRIFDQYYQQNRVAGNSHGFNPYPKKDYTEDKISIMERVHGLFAKPQEWEQILLTDPNIPLIVTKPILTGGVILSDDKYLAIKENLRQIVESALGMFPKQDIEANCVAIFVGNFTETNRGGFESKYRLMYLHWNLTDGTIIHEIIHGLLLHGVSNFYTNQWIKKFGDGKGKANDYADFPGSGNEAYYGMKNAKEDMATVGHYIFYKEGWKKIRLQEAKGSRIREKADVLIEFLTRATYGRLNREYFSRIEDGSISDPKTAQAFFKKLNRN